MNWWLLLTRRIPNNIIGAIVEANSTRKDHVADSILAKNSKVVGIYRLTMKTNSDNFRQSAIQGVELVIYEPVLEEEEFDGSRVVKDFYEFKEISDVIVANRLTDDLKDVSEKVYTRDLFSRD